MKKWQHNRSIIPVAAACIIVFVLILASIISTSAAAPVEPDMAKAKASVKYVGSEACIQCHDTAQLQLSTHFHGKAMVGK